MKQPTFHGRVLLPLSVFAEARAGDPLAMERIMRYYDGYINKLCTGNGLFISRMISSSNCWRMTLLILSRMKSWPMVCAV